MKRRRDVKDRCEKWKGVEGNHYIVKPSLNFVDCLLVFGIYLHGVRAGDRWHYEF
jgi:hypothetical protein